MKAKFLCNERVISKKTGLLISGIVVGILTGGYQKLVYHRRNNKSTLWDNLYPHWQEKFVYIVVFDQPSRIMSYEEYVNSESVGEIYKNEKDYEINCPLLYEATYPEDGLEFFVQDEHVKENYDVV